MKINRINRYLFNHRIKINERLKSIMLQKLTKFDIKIILVMLIQQKEILPKIIY